MSASGLNAHLGIVDTTGVADGAYLPADVKWLEFNSESLESDFQRIESEAIGRNRTVLSKNSFVVNPKGAAGDIDFDLTGRNLSVLLPFILTEEVDRVETPVTGANPGTNVELTHRLSTDHKEFAVIVARPGEDDTVWTRYNGCVVTGATIGAEVDGLATISVSIDTRSEDVLNPAPTVTYLPSESPVFGFGDVQTVVAKTDGTPADLKFNSIELEVSRALKTDRYNLGSYNKRRQIQSGWNEVSFNYETDFAGKNDPSYQAYRTQVIKNTFLSVEGEMSNLTSTVEFSVPYLRVDSSNPTVGGAEMLTLSVDGKCMSDETNVSPVSIKVTHFEPTVTP